MEESTHGREFYQLLKFVQYPSIGLYQPSSFDYLFENNRDGIDLLQWLKCTIEDSTVISEAELKEYEEWIGNGGVPLSGATLEMAYADHLENNNLEEDDNELELQIEMYKAHKKALKNEQEKLFTIREALSDGLKNMPLTGKTAFPRLKVSSGVDVLDLPLEKLYETVQVAGASLLNSSIFANQDVAEFWKMELDINQGIQSSAAQLEKFISELSETWGKKSCLYTDMDYIFSQLPHLAERVFEAQCEKAEVEAEVRFLSEEIQCLLYGGGRRVSENLVQTVSDKQQELNELVHSINELKPSAAESKKESLLQMSHIVIERNLADVERLKLLVVEKLSISCGLAVSQLCRLQVLGDSLSHERSQLIAMEIMFSQANKTFSVVPSSDRIAFLAKNTKPFTEEADDNQLIQILEMLGVSDYARKVGVEHCLTEFISGSNEPSREMVSWFDRKLPNRVVIGLQALERAVFGKPISKGATIARDYAVDRPIRDLETATRAFESEMKKLIKLQAKFQKDTGESRFSRVKRLAWVQFLTDPAEFRRLCNLGNQ